jgi:chemotaxis protein methyltransferase CheR
VAAEVMAEDTNITGDVLDSLLEVIYREYHYDFRSYSRASLLRGIDRAQLALGVSSTEELRARVAVDPGAFSQLLSHLTVHVSDFFRDPEYFRVVREQVVPYLATYPFVRIWVAGCSTGEEAYSMAIILGEEGLLDRSLIYATDIDGPSLEKASVGIYERKRVRGFSENYCAAGGRATLADYYVASDSHIAIGPRLRKPILFSDHSLATDAAFAEVHLVSCRNVFIYFDHTLQRRALGLFRDSLCPRGFLGLGPKETLPRCPEAAAFAAVAADQRIYQLRFDNEVRQR